MIPLTQNNHDKNPVYMFWSNNDKTISALPAEGMGEVSLKLHLRSVF